MERINGKGNLKYQSEVRQRITIRTEGEFLLVKNDDIIAPKKNDDRYAQINANKGDVLELETEGRYTLILVDLPSRGEVVSSESLVEIIPESEMSIYDKLRAEMMTTISRFAESQNKDSYEDADDFEIDDEEEALIDTPYEFKAMIEEYPIDDKTDNTEKNESNNQTEKENIQEDTDTSVSV